MKNKESYKILFKEGKPRVEMQKNPFVVPKGYFENLPQEIQDKIGMDGLNLPKEAGFSVPESYFEELPEAVYTRIAEERIKSAAQDEGFAVPKGYFKDLSSRIQQRIQEENTASPKIQKLERPEKRGIPFRRKLAYAAVACVIGIVSAAGYFQLSKTNTLQEDAHFLSEVSDEEIINYLMESSEAEDMLLLSQYFFTETEGDEGSFSSGLGKSLDDDLLEEYLNYGL